MADEQTIRFYDKNADEYFEKTVHVDMSAIYPRFLKYVKQGGTIIDIGSGSGRDILYFKKNGFQVSGIDASEELCKKAIQYTKAPISCCKIEDWNPIQTYDGIWADASLVHLSIQEIDAFLKHIPERLNTDGAVYMSFKSGIITGVDRKGRFYTNVEEADIYRILDAVCGINIEELWYSDDNLDRSDIKWMNIILRKAKASTDYE